MECFRKRKSITSNDEVSVKRPRTVKARESKESIVRQQPKRKTSVISKKTKKTEETIVRPDKVIQKSKQTTVVPFNRITSEQIIDLTDIHDTVVPFNRITSEPRVSNDIIVIDDTVVPLNRITSKPRVSNDIIVIHDTVVPSNRITSKQRVTNDLIGIHTPLARKKIISKGTVKVKHDDIDDDCESEAEDIDDDCEAEDIDSSEFNLWNIPTLLSEVSSVSYKVCENFVSLIEDDNTLPFIARYRKSHVDNLLPEKLQELFDQYSEICRFKKKVGNVLQTLKKTGKLTPGLQTSIINSRSKAELEFLYEPLKRRISTLSERARKLGLEDAAFRVMRGEYISFSSLCDSKVEGLQTPQEVETHIIHLLAEVIYKDSRVLEYIIKIKAESCIYIESSKARATKKKKPEEAASGSKNQKTKESDLDKYKHYLNFKIRVDNIKSHQTLALNRGEAAKILSIKISIPDWFYHSLERFCLTLWRGNLTAKAVTNAYNRFIKPWLSRQIRSEMTTRAEKESIAIFVSNLKNLLLTAPIKNHIIMGIDPGFRAGCKIGIINTSGQPLHTTVIFPTFDNQNPTDNQSVKLSNLCSQFKCSVIALGNGTACRETEQWLKRWGFLKNIKLVIVPEQGASIYSCSLEATKEHPGMDPNMISALSIARRAMDPMSEFVKVDPKHIGIGLYQHDVSSKLLNEALDSTVVHCVSFVGVDLNTASLALLRKISGLTDSRAKSILKYREQHCGFNNRAELLKVVGIGPKIFKQCAGFLRIPQSSNKLDNTWIHPESYETAQRLLQHINIQSKEIGTESFIKEMRLKTSKIGTSTLATRLDISESDIGLIIEALGQSEQEDPLRNNKPVYSDAINNTSQLKEGAVLTGIVSNVTTFGCFVDCGVGRNGLIHISRLGGSRMPHFGERVSVTVASPLTETRISLVLNRIC